MRFFRFPQGFLFGTATASLQIEGGDTNNSWYQWAEDGHIKDGSHCQIACDHWNRVSEDIELIKSMNQNAYRMSLEWSRIEPSRGEFSSEAIEHYRKEINLLLQNGIRPFVTLYHFSIPLWMEARGGWLNKRSADWFEQYTGFVVRELGDLVKDWITINEPNVYAYHGYVEGIWPPGKRILFIISR